MTERPLRRDLLIGAVLGALSGTFGPMLGLDPEGTAFDPRALLAIGLLGAVGGVIVALVLRLTRRFRSRGPVQHYLSWIFASMVAMLVLLLPEVPRKGWNAVAFAVLLGFCAGLGFAAVARRVNRPHQ